MGISIFLVLTPLVLTLPRSCRPQCHQPHPSVPTTVEESQADFSNRLQCVRVGHIKSPVIVSNTGAPQGCVLSPMLYTLYTNDCRSVVPSTQYVRFSDDTAMLALFATRATKMVLATVSSTPGYFTYNNS